MLVILGLIAGTIYQVTGIVVLLRKRSAFRRYCISNATQDAKENPKKYIPPIPPPKDAGFCWLDIVFPEINVKPRKIYTTAEKLQHAPSVEAFDLAQSMAYRKIDTTHLFTVWSVQNGWITNQQLAGYLRETNSLHNVLYIVRIQPFVYHISPTYQGSTMTLEELENATLPFWIGMDPFFFSDSAIKNSVLALSVADYSKALGHSKKFTPYEVPARRHRYLKEAGLPLPPPHALPHSHGVHVALRNRMRYRAALFLRNAPSWYALWARPEDEAYMTAVSGVSSPIDRWNPRYEAKDISRFAMGKAPATRAPTSTAPVWYVEDALHHLSNSAVGSWFDEHETLQYVIATVVIPPETVFGLDAVRPDLYNFVTKKRDNLLYYVPEGNKGGHYSQPLDADRWYKYNKLITPKNECLHVGMVDQEFAHALIVISRPQLLANVDRVMSMPDLQIIPWYCHPFASDRDRITVPELINALPAYATRVGKTNLRDLYSKVAQFAAAEYKHLPPSYVRAAVLYAQSTNMLDHLGSMTWMDIWALRVCYYTKLPLAGMNHLLQSAYSLTFTERLDVPKIWLAPLTTGVSYPTDSPLPGTIAPVCDASALSFYHIPPTNHLRARWAVANASWILFCIAKILIIGVGNQIINHAWLLPKAIDFITFLVGANWHDTPVGLLVFLLLAWFGVRGPRVYIYPIHKRAWQGLKQIYACLFFLPKAGLKAPAGLCTFYQLQLSLIFMIWAFPRTMPWMYLHQHHEQFDWKPVTVVKYTPGNATKGEFHTWQIRSEQVRIAGDQGGWTGGAGLDKNKRPVQPGNYTTHMPNRLEETHFIRPVDPHVTRLMFWIPFGIILFTTMVTVIIALWARPHHERPHHYHSSDTRPYAKIEYKAGGPRDPDPRPPPPPPPNDPPGYDNYLKSKKKSPSPPPSRTFTKSKDYTPIPTEMTDFAPRAPTPVLPDPQPIHRVIRQVQPLPDEERTPHVNMAPYAPPARPDNHLPMHPIRPDYNPAHFSDFHIWQTVMNALPLPPGSLDPAFQCVWDCLSKLLGVAPEKLCWIWEHHAVRNGLTVHNDGRVPHGYLEQIVNYFRLGVTVRHADMGNAVRAQFAVQVPTYSAQLPPKFIAIAAPGWPTGTVYLAGNDVGDFHLTDFAQPANNAATRIPQAWSMIAYTSTRVPLTQIREILNYPSQTWVTYYSRLNKSLPNIAAANASNMPQHTALNALNIIPLVKIKPVVIDHQLSVADLENAVYLSGDMKNHPECTELQDSSPREICTGVDQLAKAALRDGRNGKLPRVRMHLLHGAGGSGKSTFLQNYLHTIAPQGGYNVSNLRFVAWDATLRKALQRDMEPVFPQLMSHNYVTKCVPFATPLPGVLVIDDATKCWNGYIPLIIALNAQITDIVVTFDLTQSLTVFPHADSDSRSAPTTGDFLRPLSTHYATDVHRYSNDIKALFGLPVSPEVNTVKGKVYLVSQAPRDIVFLVVSPRFAETQNNGGRPTMTFNSCQGVTIDGDVAIDLGGLTATATDYTVWTALTRARGNIFLVLGAQLSSPKTISPTGFGQSQILSAILAVSARAQTACLTASDDPERLIARAVHSHFAHALGPITSRALGINRVEPIIGSYVQAKYRVPYYNTLHWSKGGDHFTPRSYRACYTKPSARGPAFSAARTNVNHSSRREYVTQALRHLYPVALDNELAMPSTGYKLPEVRTLNGKFDPVHLHDHFVNEDDREAKIPGHKWKTTQHIHDGPHSYLHHLGRDKATQLISEQKRIQVGKVRPRSAQDIQRFKQLKRGLAKFMDVDALNSEGFRPDVYEESLKYVLAPWVSKRTGTDIERSLAKNDLDQVRNHVRLFLKQQFVKKEDKRYARATAGQIVSEFGLSKQFEDAPFALYVELRVMELTFPTTYLHSRASPADMEAWYAKHWTPHTPMTANDWTAWDSGCDRPFIDLILWIQELCGVPKEYRDKYEFDRLNTWSHLGTHLPRQESGDRWTWLANTICNMAITGASINCPKRTPAAFSGDDGNVLGHWRYQPDFRFHQWTMKPKQVISDRIEFCGHQFGDDHVQISSTVVLHRAQAGLALGRNDHEYWDSIYNAYREAGQHAEDFDDTLLAVKHFLHLATECFDLPPYST